MSGLYYLTNEPPNAGVPLSAQSGRLLSQEEMYMRNNFSFPESAPRSIEILIPGEPTRSVTAADLDAYPQVTKTVVLECAGNGRTLMHPVPEGTPWDLGGASLIEVRGTSLVDVLGGLPESISEVVFTGADNGVVAPEGEINYQFSLEREHAISGSPLLVTHIDGAPLTLEHGAPIRLVVPGHYAMKSVKWLKRIEAIEERFDGHFVNKYRYYGDADEPERSRVGRMRVRSIVASPKDGEEMASPFMLSGMAWTGMGTVERVEVTLDRGMSWTDTTLRHHDGFTTWACQIDSSQRPLEIAVRATDTAGNTQPVRARWNANGYANNVCHAITIGRDQG